MKKTNGVMTVAWLGIPLLVLAAGCGGQKEESSERAPAREEASRATETAPAVDVATTATVTGRILFEGTAPRMRLIDMSSEQTCHEHSESDPIYTENVVVNQNGTLRYVFVYVKEGLEGRAFPAPREPVVLDQRGCHYEPHIFGIQTAQPLTIKNSDEGVLHNIHALSDKRNGFNFGMPRLMESTKEFKRSEVMVRIKCDVHGWMSAYAGVLDHPYYSVTGESGTFELAPLPPGDYVIEAWHEEYGAQTQSITVAQKETKEITFTFKPK